MEEFLGPPAQAPSYALESSSGESDWGSEDELAHHAPKTKELAQDAVVELEGAPRKGGDVVFLVGEAGENLGKGIKVDDDALVKVTVDGQQMATIRTVLGTTLVFLSAELPLASLHPLASTLLSTLAPENTTIISSYHLPSYIFEARPTSAPILYLRSQATPSLTSLATSGDLTPYQPPNLLHGLASLLLTLSSLAKTPSTLILFPSTAIPAPLNGPFISTSSQAFYDAGPTSLSDPGGLYRELQGKLSRVAQGLGWTWWSPKEAKGDGFAWLDSQRKQRRKEELNSMYM